MQNRVKRASNILLILLFISLFMAIIYLHHFMADKIIKQDILEENKQIVQIYRDNIWQKYLPDIKGLVNQDKRVWKDNEAFVRLAASSFKFFKKYSAVKVRVYNNHEDKLLSTNKFKINDLQDIKETTDNINNIHNFSMILDRLDMLFSKTQNIKPKEAALNGQINGLIFLSTIYRNPDGEVKRGTLIRSYIPINTPSEDDLFQSVSGLVEITQDISTQWEQLNFIRLVAMLVLLLIIIVVYLTLYFNNKGIKHIIDIKRSENLHLLQIKEHAENSNKRKSEFLANVSHELKTPLNAIIGFADILKNEVYGPLGHKKYKDYICDIHISGIHLLGLINDILDYSKAVAGKLTIECIPMDVRKVINSSIRMLNPKSQEAAVEVVANLSDESLVIIADSRRLKQALINIISNSIKFTHSGGRITIKSYYSLDADANKILVITIEDNGIGIAKNDLSKAVGSFEQVDSKLNRKYEGTGLGIPFTKSLIEMMNGKFYLESELGIGTKVTFSFYAEHIVQK